MNEVLNFTFLKSKLCIRLGSHFNDKISLERVVQLKLFKYTWKNFICIAYYRRIDILRVIFMSQSVNISQRGGNWKSKISKLFSLIELSFLSFILEYYFFLGRKLVCFLFRKIFLSENLTSVLWKGKSNTTAKNEQHLIEGQR